MSFQELADEECLPTFLKMTFLLLAMTFGIDWLNLMQCFVVILVGVFTFVGHSLCNEYYIYKLNIHRLHIFSNFLN